MGERVPMRTMVEAVLRACDDWLEIDTLPSPPAPADWRRPTDRTLAKVIEDLCRAYPQQMGCDRHPSGAGGAGDA